MSSRRRSRRGEPEAETEKETDQPKENEATPTTEDLDESKEVENDMTEDDTVDDDHDGTADSEDGGLVIASDMQEGKDTDDTEKDSEHSEEEEQAQLIFNGTMTRRQSKQFQDAGSNFAVFSVRPGVKSKNRTCEYCGVVKATPAALVRHIRKHTGERPFVCQLCGKAYKAKRSLHLHQNSHHKEMGKMLPPNPSSLPTQVPIPSPIIAQMSPTPAISEATKSLLRETLESSRKARDGSSGSQTPEAVLSVTSSGASSRTSERLSTPNLVNLLTSDISKKAQEGEEAVSLLKTPNIVLKASADGSTHYIVSPASVKKEFEDEILDGEKVEAEEEKAEDLSMATLQKPSYPHQSSADRRIKCDFCNKSFKHEISRTNHMRTAHSFILNASGNLQPQFDSFTLIEPKSISNNNLTVLPQRNLKLESANQKQEMATDLSIASILSRKVKESPSSLISQETMKMEMPTVVNAAGDGVTLDESNTLPYHVTSRMIQDFDVEQLNIKDTEKSVLAEDGGNRRVKMTVQRETVLASRQDCINNVTGRMATVFKCHLCNRVFSSLMRYNHHLPSHFDTEIQTYDCRYCEASFRSLSQIVKHLQCHREKFTGLNAAGTGLNSSALLLEEFHKKQKPETHGDNSNSLNASTFSSMFQSDESLSNTPHLEPGERANGGYSCVKCRKSFSREYMLQRHMQIHKNQGLFYCSECDVGFNGEMDLVEHRRQVHGGKGTGQSQYSSLLKSLNSSVYDPKTGQGARQVSASSSSNNSSSSRIGVGANTYPLVDMKAFDLKRGEAVEVRMASEVNDAEVRRLMLEEYQQYNTMLLMRAAAAARDNDQMRQVLTPAAATEELKRRMKMEEEMKKMEKRRREEEEARMKEENEKRRKMEQEKLKQKLAQEGMGDVTVVLPDAPPPDDGTDVTRDTDRPTDLSATGGPPSGIGFMARKTPTAPSSSASASRIDHVLQSEYGGGSSSMQGLEKTLSTTDAVTSLKRPAPSTSTTDPCPVPSKNRRKAHKPQRINHCLEERESVEGEKIEDDNNNNSKTSTLSAISSLSQLHTAQATNQSVKGAGFSLDNPAMLSAAMINQMNQLASTEGAGSILATDIARKHLSALTASNLIPQVPSTSTALFNTAAAIANYNSNDDDDSGAIDLSTVSKSRQAKLSGAASTHQNFLSKAQASSPSSSPSSNSSPADGASKQGSKKRKSSIPSFTRSISLDPAALDSDNSLSQELTSAADLSKTSLLNLQIPASQNSFSSVNPSAVSPTDADGLVGCPRVLWKPGQALTSDVPENFLGVFQGGPFNGKGGKSSASVACKSRTSSPSPVPSPTNSDASSSAEGRKINATSLSRTHSRLSVVNEPLDRNSLCKPKVLDDGRSVYSCAICHKNFLSLSDINRHMDFHEDIRPYKCKYCDYYARTNSQLKVHKLRHEGVREFCCRVCNYKGVTQSDLNRHTKSQVHLLRSKHVCIQCGEGFVTPKNLRVHSTSCTGVVDKNFETMSPNDNDDEINEDDYEEEELMNAEESNSGVTEEVAVG